MADFDDEKTTITVKDTGIGISKENAKKLFRIDKKYIGTNNNGEKGTGIGLILCKEFVENHNGEIWVNSKYGKGSMFSFTIPNSVIKTTI